MMIRSSLKRLLPVLLIGLALLIPHRDAQAQLGDDLQVYGFFQGQYRNSTEQGFNSPDKFSSFSVQQLNAFLSKQFSPSFSAFVGAELTNTFSSGSGWGSLRLEEAWVRYNRSSKLNAKAGLLVPKFNNLNEIKNRTPLLPYIFRPLAYEASYASAVNLESLVPTQAFGQVYGALPLGDVRIDYAAYVGNSESSYISATSIGTVTPGTDTTSFKMVGGRVGLRWRTLKAGVSATRDKRRMDHVEINDMLIPIGLGDADRTRIGADLSLSIRGVFAEVEMIRVLHGLDEGQQTRLDFLATSEHSPMRGILTGDPDMSFYYGLLGYNVTSQLFVYTMYNYFKDGSMAVMTKGLDVYSAGVGFRPIDAVVLKGQYYNAQARENAMGDITSDTFCLAVSVFF